MAAWALARMAAALAEDVPFLAEVDCVERQERRTERLETSSAVLREEEGGDPGLKTLFDPAVLLRGVGTVSARHGTRCGRPCVVLEVVPHPTWAQSESAWLQPGADTVLLEVDTATGFLLGARTPHRGDGPSEYRVTRLSTGERAEGEMAVGSRRALARMAGTLLEPLGARAQVVVHTQSVGQQLRASDPAPKVGERGWTVTLSGPMQDVVQVQMGDEHDPQHTVFVLARLAEMLTPARLVSALHHVRPVEGEAMTVEATVREMQTFPMSVWAPDESVTCRFTVDPDTGVLTHASAHIDERYLAAYEVTEVSRE